MSNKSEKSALFELTDDALYVANGGRPFSRLGVIGICAAHISDKGSAPLDELPKVSNEALVDAIRKREIDTYEVSSYRLFSDSRGEKEVSHDYQGRFVWELLQNADDAMGPEKRSDLIGSKGLGFKSVLEITEKPEIYSGLFHFGFSPDKTKQLLIDEGISKDPPKLIFRIPHNCQQDPKVRELLNDYTTVIRLSFPEDQEARGKARETAKKALADLKPHFLLLSQQLDAVRITGLEQGERLYRIEREGEGLSDGEIDLHTPEGSSFWKRWVESEVADNEGKKVTVSIALPVKNGEAVPFDSELPFHVFFPTEESLGVKALVHASFELEQNRKHLRQGDNDDKILSLFDKLVGKVIQGTPPQTALKIFGSVECNDSDGERLLEKIKASIFNKMRTTPFVPVIGGGKLPSTETRLWKDGLGDILREDEQAVKEAKLVAPALSNLFSNLKDLGAQYIEDDEHIQLLRYCRNGSQEECIASFRALAKTGLNWLHQQYGERENYRLALLHEVPCWWTNKQTSRSLEAKPPLLWKKPDEDEWPDWLAVDTLHSEFRDEIEKWEREEKSDSYKQPWIKLTRGRLSQDKEHYIYWVLIPAIKGWEQQQWEQQGYEVLKWLAVWEKPHNFNDTPPWIKYDEDDPNRGNLATSLRLPTDKGWFPAVDCFAGKDWDGPKAFDKFFAGQTILPLEKWRKDLQHIEKDRWKGLLRWSGVSWEPKVCQTPDFKVDHPLWEKYTLEGRTFDGGKNYLIQNFPDCIKEVKNKELIQDIFPALFGLIKNKNATRYYNKTIHGKKKHRGSLSSLALKQLEKKAWLPVKPSLLEDRERIPPKEAFLPGKGLRPLLPQVDRSGIDDRRWFGGLEDIENRLRNLGVMDELPHGDSQWHDWMKQLAEKGEIAETSETWPDLQAPNDWKWKSGEGNQLWQAACSLYGKYLEKSEWLPLPEDIKIPCVRLKNGQRILSFNPPDEVYWIDESYLADSTLERNILDRHCRLFIFRLNQGENSERLGVKKLSEVIEVKPCYDPDPDYENSIKALFQRYEEEKRKIVLEKVCNIELPQFDDLQIKAVRGLKLKLSINGKELEEYPTVESWKDSGPGDILIDVANNKWDTFAHALAHRWDGGEHKKHHATLENYFSAGQDKFKRRALDMGFTEEALGPPIDPEKDTEAIDTTEAPNTSEVGGGTRTTERGKETPDTTKTPNTLGVDGDPETTEKGKETPDTTKTPNTLGVDGDTRTSSGKGTPPPGPDGETTDELSFEERENPRGGGTLNPESGLNAEEWLWEKLNSRYSAVEDMRTDKRAGADFILHLNDRRKVYIEAKHVETHTGVIHWSKRQYERANKEREEGNPYFIAVLSPGDDSTKYAIHWVWDPLEKLKELEKREVVWEGKSAPQRLPKEEWEATDPLVVPTRTFDIKITLENSISQDENKDDCRLATLEEKIRRHRVAGVK